MKYQSYSIKGIIYLLATSVIFGWFAWTYWAHTKTQHLKSTSNAIHSIISDRLTHHENLAKFIAQQLSTSKLLADEKSITVYLNQLSNINEYINHDDTQAFSLTLVDSNNHTYTPYGQSDDAFFNAYRSDIAKCRADPNHLFLFTKKAANHDDIVYYGLGILDQNKKYLGTAILGEQKNILHNLNFPTVASVKLVHNHQKHELTLMHKSAPASHYLKNAQSVTKERKLQLIPYVLEVQFEPQALIAMLIKQVGQLCLIFIACLILVYLTRKFVQHQRTNSLKNIQSDLVSMTQNKEYVSKHQALSAISQYIISLREQVNDLESQHSQSNQNELELQQELNNTKTDLNSKSKEIEQLYCCIKTLTSFTDKIKFNLFDRIENAALLAKIIIKEKLDTPNLLNKIISMLEPFESDLDLKNHFGKFSIKNSINVVIDILLSLTLKNETRLNVNYQLKIKNAVNKLLRLMRLSKIQPSLRVCFIFAPKLCRIAAYIRKS